MVDFPILEHRHDLPKYVPGTPKTNLLSNPRQIRPVNEARIANWQPGDDFLWRRLWERYGETPFPRGYIDVGRLSRLFGRQVMPASQPFDPASREALLRCVEFPDACRELYRGRPTRGSGESEEHRALKHFIAQNPGILGLSITKTPGEPEYWLKSGDRVDVVFDEEHEIVLVEVKPASAPVDDIERGLYQCVKYDAVVMASLRAAGISKVVHARLVLGGFFPASLMRVRKALGVSVIENVQAT